MDKRIRIAFLGDITCDRPMLKAAYKDGRYQFISSLEKIKLLVSDSDLVIANLETVFGGREYGYNPYSITYNSPDSLCDGLIAAGINIVTTANNHCLDMGIKGLSRTIKVLDRNNILHTGTFLSEYKGKRYLLINVQGCKIAIVSFTDQINGKLNGNAYSQKELASVNCLRTTTNIKHKKQRIKTVFPTVMLKQTKAFIKRLMGVPLVSVRIDNEAIDPKDMSKIDDAIKLLRQAKEDSDFVIACIHSGGQFNVSPGTHSQTLYDLLEPYCDAIIGNHPHVVQRLEVKSKKIRAYSLGSVNMSASADYVHSDTDFDYSMIMKIDIRKEKNVNIENIEGIVLHAQENEAHYIIVSEANDEKAEKVKLRFFNNLESLPECTN